MNHKNRRSIRLPGYDYAQEGAYYITICTHNRMCLFGDVLDGEMVLNNIGRYADICWRQIPEHFPNAVLHEFVIMPNHIHGIIEITVGANNYLPGNNYLPDQQINQEAKDVSDINNRAKDISPLRGTSKTIGSIVRGFKIGVTKYMRMHTDIHNVWQRNYYEHIIRDGEDYDRIAHYILDNPRAWNTDQYNT